MVAIGNVERQRQGGRSSWRIWHAVAMCVIVLVHITYLATSLHRVCMYLKRKCEVCLQVWSTTAGVRRMIIFVWLRSVCLFNVLFVWLRFTHPNKQYSGSTYAWPITSIHFLSPPCDLQESRCIMMTHPWASNWSWRKEVLVQAIEVCNVSH